MSRIGLKPITIPAGVDVNINSNTVTVKGPNGTLTMDAHPNMDISVEGSESSLKDLTIRKKTDLFTALPAHLLPIW